MSVSLAGLFILAVLFTGALVMWRANMVGEQLNGSAQKASANLQGQQVRTIPTITSAVGDRNNNTLTLTVRNNGNTSVGVSKFPKMDLIVVYDDGAQDPLELTYTESITPADGEWTDGAISGDFEPDVWNPEEDLVINATLLGTTCYPGTAIVSTPNGVEDSYPFVCSTLTLYLHSETSTINAVDYYQLKNGIPADGAATTISSVFGALQVGRVRPASNDGKFVYPLTNVVQLPADDWDITYRVRRDEEDQGFVWIPNADNISINTVSGTHDGAGNSTFLEDEDGDFLKNGILVGDTISNTTDGSSATVATVSATTITGTLAGGTDNDWDTADAYTRAAPLNVWRDINLAPFVPVGATGAIVEVLESTDTDNISGLVRAKEDARNYMSDAAYNNIKKKYHRWQIVKVDSNRYIQGFVEAENIDFRLLGYTLGSDPSYIISGGVTPDVSPAQFLQWQTVDLSEYVDSDAEGAILFIVHNNSDDVLYGIREVGSSFALGTEGLKEHAFTFYAVGLSPQKHFEAYIANADFEIYLVAQTKDSVIYYVNDSSVVDPAIGSWQTIDADDYNIPGLANGLVLYIDANAGTHKIDFRHGDSTDDHDPGKDLRDKTHLQAAVGLNSSNEWDEYMENTDDDIYIAGYTRLVRLDVKANVDVVVRKADGTIRSTLGDDVADTAAITSTDWQTFTVTWAFPGYTVIDQTDYLEIDLYADATVNDSAEAVSVQFRIDDPSLPIADQMKIVENAP